MAQMKKVLAVDDENDIVQLVKDELTATGLFMVVTANDGAEAFRKANNEKFDLIITDFKMPRMDGTKLISAIVHEKHYKGIPKIVVTSHPDVAESTFKRLGITENVAFVGKPFDIAQLIEMIKEMISKSEKANANQSQTRINVDFLNPFIDSVIATVSSLGQAKDISSDKPNLLKKGQKIGVDICGSVDIECPQFKGHLAVSFPGQTYSELLSRMLGEDYVEKDENYDTAVAELLNIIYCQTKKKVNAMGYDLKQTIPEILNAEKMQEKTNLASATIVTEIKSDLGNFFITIGIDGNVKA